MPGRPISDDERQRIIDTLRSTGNVAETARHHGRGKATVSRIAHAEGIGVERSATKRATEARRADNAAKRAALISGMYDDAARLRLQLFAPAVERKALVVSDGMQAGSHVEIIEVEHPEPLFSDKRNIAVSVKVLVDGAGNLERVESGDGEAAGLIVALVEGLRPQ